MRDLRSHLASPGRARLLPSPGDVAALLRLPAVLSVPGDALTGAAAAGGRQHPAAVARTGASACLYLAGMALNDWADREVDALERPGRPIPSGRVTPVFALGLAGTLTAAGVAWAAATGGRPALTVAIPLAGAVWSYDLAWKRGRAGPVGMAACRSLDVLLGAAGAGGARAALPAAAVVGAHTLVVTAVSRREAHGAGPGLGRAALVGTAGVTVAAGAVAVGLARRSGLSVPGVPTRQLAARAGNAGWRTAAAGGLLAGYATSLGRAEVAAVADPAPERIQAVVGAGVLGIMLLEGALLAAAGRAPAAVVVAGAWPLARLLARRRPVT